MKYKILALIILLLPFVSKPLIASDLEHETIMPLADTYIEASSVNSAYGQGDCLEVSDFVKASEYARARSIAVLMFDISEVSHVLSASSEVKLRLYMHVYRRSPYHAMPYIPVRMRTDIGVHWCVNNNWNEENLTFVSFGGFFRTTPESVVSIGGYTNQFPIWCEWKVTNLVNKAMEENYEKITLTLEVIPPSEGMARFISKDQKTQEIREYSPQLVFTHLEPETNSLHTIITVALGLAAAVAIVFLTDKLLRRHARKKRRQK